MSEPRRYGAGRVGAVALAAMVAWCAATTTAAAAPAGELTKATANAAWTRGAIEGTVRCDGCFGGTPAYVRWTPVITVQPNLPSYSCRGDEWADSDPNTTVVWSGSARTTNDALAISVPDAILLPGVVGQRACLIVVATIKRRDPVCVAQAPILGMDPNDCPLEDTLVEHAVAARSFAIEAPPTPQPQPQATPQPQPQPPATPTPSPAPTPAPTPAAAALTRTAAEAAARKEATRKLGKSWRRGTRRKVTCTRQTTVRYSCRAQWRYRARTRRATIVVTVATDGQPKARVTR